ncbi:MAG: capsular biosynthesis protein [Rhodobacteraceae bacterium]|nr:capsular biosynthesis protein [Paracoccaceae bacterium]
MGKITGAGKVFLFLQGPHGPFFHQLSRVLKTSGAEVFKVGFNQGDRAFWKDTDSYIGYFGRLEDWPDQVRILFAEKNITDIVLYGDTRLVHAEAVKAARQAGITVHCFEEGYLRPYWVTYERGGVNGFSRLCELSVAEMRAELQERDLDLPDAPARWGDMRHHAFYGALYHGHILFRNREYQNYRTHRDVSVLQEFRLHFRRFLSIPWHAAQRRAASLRIRRDGFVYHLVLLQLSHDASIQFHSPLRSMPEFIRLTIEAFAAGAPVHHHLVIKTHPLEDGRFPLASITRDTAQEFGVAARVHFVRGGKLAGLLNFARSVVTVNSTAAQQALWRGLPLKAFGNSVYYKPEFVSEQPLDEFFAEPGKPDARAYRDYRHYLLETSQVMGGFYSAKSRRRLIRGVVDRVLAKADPYDSLKLENAAPKQQLRVVN